MQNNINTILTGLGGLLSVEVTEAVTHSLPAPEDIANVGQIIIQVVIGIITIWKLIKKPKK